MAFDMRGGPDDGFEELEVVRGDKRVTWEHIGEGFSGEYDPEDPEDYPHLRFSCDQLCTGTNENPDTWWESISDGSYCTRLPITTPRHLLERASQRILDALEQPSPKRQLEQLSWLCLEDFEEFKHGSNS